MLGERWNSSVLLLDHSDSRGPGVFTAKLTDMLSVWDLTGLARPMADNDVTCAAVHVIEWRTPVWTVILESPTLIKVKQKIMLLSFSWERFSTHCFMYIINKLSQETHHSLCKSWCCLANWCNLIRCDKVQHFSRVGLRIHCGMQTLWTKSIMTLILDK